MAFNLYKETGEGASYKYVEEGTQGAGFTDVNESIADWDATLRYLDEYSIASHTNKDFLYHVEEMRRIVLDKADAAILGTATTPPVSPNDGDKWEIIATATGDFTGHEGKIGKWDNTGSQWLILDKEEVGFDECTTGDQLILCKYEIGTDDQRRSLVGDAGIVGYSMLFAGKATPARQYRAANAISTLRANFTFSERDTLETEGIDENIYSSYVIHGRYGTVRSESAGIYDWVYGTAGTKFDGVGLIDKGWTPQTGDTLQQVCDKIIDQLVNGNQLA